jgi:flagellar motor switch protein FliG
MSAAETNTGKGRVLGNKDLVGGNPEVKAWMPPGEAAVDALPPLPQPQSRPRRPGAKKEEAPQEPETAVEAVAAPPVLPADIKKDSTHAYIFYHAREAAAVLRTIMRCDEGGQEDGPLAGFSAQQVVATFMIALGKEVGGQVIEYLNQNEIEYAGRSIAQLAEVPHQTGLHALEMVQRRMVEGDYVEVGGPDYARELLEEGLGWREVGAYTGALYGGTSGFACLKNVTPDQIAPFISNEHPQTIALILSQLDPSQAAGILALLPERMQPDVSYRIATMENITPNILRQIEESLEQSLRDILGGNQDAGGPKVVADMLNMTGSSVERNVLNALDSQDSEVGESVRNLMFTFDDIVKMTDREIQTLLREVDQKHLTIALKAASEELKEKILGNMSEQARTALRIVDLTTFPFRGVDS